MPRLPGDISPATGTGKGGAGTDRPSYELRRKDPAKWQAMVRLAARARLEGRSWIVAARESGIPYNTLKSWQKAPTSKGALFWFATLEAEGIKAGLDKEGERLPDKEFVVTTEGFKSPEELAEHWAIEATRIQVETMLDEKSGRKDRLDAAKHIQGLSGHSPISKSVVVSAPLDDPRVAKAIMAVLDEVRSLQASPPPKLIEGEILEGEPA